MTAELALLFCCAPEQSPQYWLNLAYDLKVTEAAISEQLQAVTELVPVWTALQELCSGVTPGLIFSGSVREHIFESQMNTDKMYKCDFHYFHFRKTIEQPISKGTRHDQPSGICQ